MTLTSGGKALDPEMNIGRFNPLPALEEVQSVPMRIFAAAPLANITDVIIYQHGVTSVKENALRPGPPARWCQCPGEQERGRGGDRSSVAR